MKGYDNLLDSAFKVEKGDQQEKNKYEKQERCLFLENIYPFKKLRCVTNIKALELCPLTFFSKIDFF